MTSDCNELKKQGIICQTQDGVVSVRIRVVAGQLKSSQLKARC